MKKFLSTVICLVFCASCDKELSSLEGTVWKYRGGNDANGDWNEIELVFSATHATITETYSWGGVETFTGTYTFDPPNVTIVGDVWISEGVTLQMPYDMVHEGVIRGETMEIGIQAYDMIMITFLEKQ